MTASLASMTGFARAEGVASGQSWVWELRSVNGRGLDLRFRLPVGREQLEPALRERAQAVLKRGNVTASLTLRREEPDRLVPDPAALEQALSLVAALRDRIPGCPPPRAEALLALPGVIRPLAPEHDDRDEAVTAALRTGFDEALGALALARQAEGARLRTTLLGQLERIAGLHEKAHELAADQPALQRARMLEAVQALLRDAPGLPEERIAQEVALLVSRSDVREELDRLASHIEAAHALLAEAAGIGRRLEFLVQEFNREANTLCSKSASVTLTATGLDLKAAIEQLREQAANIE